MTGTPFRARVLGASVGWTTPVLGPDGEHVWGTYPGSGSLLKHPLYRHHNAPRGAVVELPLADLVRLRALGVIEVLETPDPFTDYAVPVEHQEPLQAPAPAEATTSTPEPSEGPTGTLPGGEHPIHTGSGWYTLSNGETVRGKDAAEQAEAALHEGS